MIYFCVPAYNEEATVGLLLWKIRRVLEASSREYLLLVGDDASTDSTEDVLEPYQQVLPLVVLRSPSHQGYAATVEGLLKEALTRSDRHKRDIAVVMPADFAVDPDALPEFLKCIDSGADLVVGESTLTGDVGKWERRVREWAPRLLGRRARISGVRDVVSGFAAFRLVSLRNAFRECEGPWLTTEDWAANAQLLSWAAAGSRRVEVVPVTERLDRHTRAHRHAPWARARALWAARRLLPEPPAGPKGERAQQSGPRGQEAA
jgi:glycosyltransferase involved in cell wall biosynthesis